MNKSCKLNVEQHELIYTEKIAPRYLPRSKPQEQPCAVITGGQPGSGKSSLTALAIKRFQDGGYVLVDADKMRPYHPEYSNLLRSDDKKAANLTHADCGPWATRLMRDGMAGRRNLIVDQTSRDPVALDAMSRGLRQAGYRVELHVMAVPANVSEQRIHQRYEGQRARDGFGRFSTKDKHDEAFSGVAITVAAAETQKQVDRLCLYDRSAKTIYDNQIVHGKWQNPPQANQSLNAERTRAMISEEAYQFAAGWETLARQLEEPERKATMQEKAFIRERYAQAVEQAIHIAPQTGKLLVARAEAGRRFVYENLSAPDITTVMRQFDKRALTDLRIQAIPQSQIRDDELNR